MYIFPGGNIKCLVDEGSYILPQIQEPVGGAGQNMRGVDPPTKRQEKCQWGQSGRFGEDFEISHLMLESTALLREVTFSSRNPVGAIDLFACSRNGHGIGNILLWPSCGRDRRLCDD